MKYIKKLPIVALSLLALSSCDDNKMDWYNDPTHGEITGAELPLQLAEKITRYDVLKNYSKSINPNFILGNGIDISLYMTSEPYRNLVNNNFDEVVAGYDMKHGAMVGSNGAINFAKVDAFIAKTKEAGLSVFGHTLVWHSNQNAVYLNGLIPDQVSVPASSGINVLDLTGLTSGTFSGWAKNNPGNGITIENNLGIATNTKALKMSSNASASAPYNLQLVTPSIPIVSGHHYQLSFYIKSDALGKGRISYSSTVSNQYPYNDWYHSGASKSEAFTTNALWQRVSIPINDASANPPIDFTSGATSFKFAFDLGYLPNVNYLIDVNSIEVVDLDNSNNVVVAEQKQNMPLNQKATIIGAAMEDWISKMVGHYKNDVHAWDVVNEPMKEDGNLRDGTESTTATDYFSWVKYLGRDYAATAFKLARQYGNASDKLFINDYNLESSLDKCDGIIRYVGEIESKGAVVDGIGTQMHISLSTNKDKIAEMFQKLGATGKLIKISELDISLGTKDPTPAQLADQAAMYQYVIDKYNQYIPVAQQYGVTIWGVSDKANEHEFWLKDQSPNIWDANYNRKHAYIGVANGLAGRDVSKDFSGELQP